MNQSQNGYQQPLPPPPHSEHHDPRQLERPKSKSGFSFRSQKSHDSSGSAPKTELFETPREKARRRLSTKADPRLAMSEAEPSAVASDHSSLLAPLREIQHRDVNGLPIADPDRSNPTRSRWERPLDTIRSFEAAIDGNYSRKSGRPDPPDSRRTSYYGGSTVGAPRTHQDNGYGGGRGGHGTGPGAKPDGYYDNNYNNNGYLPNRARYPRNAPESTLNNGVYPPNGNHQSYETVTTASGSGSSGEPLGYTTDPSSDNNSIDQFSKPEYSNQSNGQYSGGNSYGGYPSVSNQQYVAGGAGYQANGHQSQNRHQSQNGPQPPPPKMESAPPRAPMIKLGKSADGPTNYETVRPVPEKRKSWFGRRFGKA